MGRAGWKRGGGGGGKGEKPTSNSSRVAGVVLRNILLNLAHQVSPNISSLGVDSSSHSSKQSNGGTTQTVTCDGLIQTMPVIAKDLYPHDNADYLLVELIMP